MGDKAKRRDRSNKSEQSQAQSAARLERQKERGSKSFGGSDKHIAEGRGQSGHQR